MANLAALYGLMRMSKSLIFVPDKPTAKVVRNVAHQLAMPTLVGDSEKIAEVVNFEHDKEHFAVIAVVPKLVHGWQSKAEQIIWVGPVPDVMSGAWSDYTAALCCTADNDTPIIHIENHGAVQ